MKTGIFAATPLIASVEVGGSTTDTEIAVDAGGDEVVHHAALDGGVGTLGIFELQIEVRQLLLRLGDSRFHDLPEVRRPVHDESDLGLSCAKAKVDIATDAAKARLNRYAVFMLHPPCLHAAGVPLLQCQGTGGYSERIANFY